MWTVNFQLLKLVLEKAEELETKLLTSAGSLKKQESSRKSIYFCFTEYAKTFDCVDHNKLWKILKQMGILDHLTCFLRSGEISMQVKKQQLETDVELRTGSKLEKEYIKAVLLPCLFKLYAEYIMRNAGLEEA